MTTALGAGRLAKLVPISAQPTQSNEQNEHSSERFTHRSTRGEGRLFQACSAAMVANLEMVGFLYVVRRVFENRAFPDLARRSIDGRNKRSRFLSVENWWLDQTLGRLERSSSGQLPVIEAMAATAFTFTIFILALGYACFGFWTTIIFTSGFLGGFVLWITVPHVNRFAPFRLPYFLTLGAFILHRVEEKLSGFFPALAKITEVPTPAINSWPVILLVVTSVGGWLLIPYLVKRNFEFGYYLAWTFFAAMGITELAHLIFPFIADGRFTYFPGLGTALIVAPCGWWGMRCLARSHHFVTT